jgi:hypothetical protein
MDIDEDIMNDDQVMNSPSPTPVKVEMAVSPEPKMEEPEEEQKSPSPVIKPMKVEPVHVAKPTPAPTQA